MMKTSHGSQPETDTNGLVSNAARLADAQRAAVASWEAEHRHSLSPGVRLVPSDDSEDEDEGEGNGEAGSTSAVTPTSPTTHCASAPTSYIRGHRNLVRPHTSQNSNSPLQNFARPRDLFSVFKDLDALRLACDIANLTQGELRQLERKVKGYLSSVDGVDRDNWDFETKPYHTDSSITQTADRLYMITQALSALPDSARSDVVYADNETAVARSTGYWLGARDNAESSIQSMLGGLEDEILGCKSQYDNLVEPWTAWVRGEPQRPKSDDVLGRIRYLTTQFDDTRGSRVQVQYEDEAPHRVERVTSEDGKVLSWERSRLRGIWLAWRRLRLSHTESTATSE